MGPQAGAREEPLSGSDGPVRDLQRDERNTHRRDQQESARSRSTVVVTGSAGS